MKLTKIITLISVLTVVSFVSKAQQEFKIDGIRYETTSTTEVKVIADTAKYHGKIIIPDSVKNDDTTYAVTAVGTEAFHLCVLLDTVIIGNSVKTIGIKAFADNSALKFVEIGSSVKSILSSAFYNCAQLTELTIPNSVIVISNNAFNNCVGLTSLHIPSSVLMIGTSVFVYCNNLTDVTVDQNNPNFSSLDGVLFNKLQDTLLLYPSAKAGESYQIPTSVKRIGGHAFFKCFHLKSVVIPAAVSTIGNAAFLDCTALERVTIGKSVDTIFETAFAACTGLRDIYLKPITPPYLDVNVFLAIQQNNVTVHVPCQTENDYQGWGGFNNIVADILPDVFLFSNDTNKGVAVLHQAQTSCGDNTVIILAQPQSNARFIRWNDNDTTALRTIFVTQDTTFTAEFINTFNITLHVNDAVMGTTAGEGTYDEGQTATISATPNANYRFVRWNDGDTISPRNIIVTEDMAFTAYFAATSNNIEEIKENFISIYPNPTHDKITVLLPDNTSHAVFTLHDLQGKILLRQTVTHQDKVWFNGIASGLYMYSIETENHSHQGKVSITN